MEIVLGDQTAVWIVRSPWKTRTTATWRQLQLHSYSC